MNETVSKPEYESHMIYSLKIILALSCEKVTGHPNMAISGGVRKFISIS